MTRHIGYSITEALTALSSRTMAGTGEAAVTSSKADVIARFFVSVVVLLLGVYLVARTDQPDSVRNLGAGFVGTVAGYWLR